MGPEEDLRGAISGICTSIILWSDSHLREHEKSMEAHAKVDLVEASIEGTGKVLINRTNHGTCR